jgi:hypothetical protein
VYSTSGSITGNYYLPFAALGGEDFTISAFVKGNNPAKYTIGGNSYYFGTTNKWNRISGTIQLAAGATSGTFTIAVANITGMSAATEMYVDGVQGEYGREVTDFVDPADAATTTFINPINNTKTFIAAQSQNISGGKSAWFYNYDVKATRLKDTLGRYTIHGSTWALKTGLPTEEYKDLTESLVSNNSFETSLGGWTASSNATLSRRIAKGYLFSDTVTHGQAYCRVSYNSTSSTTPYSITSDKIYIDNDKGFYASAAIRPSTAASVNDTYTLRVDFYNGNDVLMPVYTDNQTGQLTTSKYDGTGSINTSATLSTIRTSAITPDLTDRWFYVSKTFNGGSVQGAVYAILSITCTPVSSASAKSFDVDRIVFRH